MVTIQKRHLISASGQVFTNVEHLIEIGDLLVAHTYLREIGWLARANDSRAVNVAPVVEVVLEAELGAVTLKVVELVHVDAVAIIGHNLARQDNTNKNKIHILF